MAHLSILPFLIEFSINKLYQYSQRCASTFFVFANVPNRLWPVKAKSQTDRPIGQHTHPDLSPKSTVTTL
jgi:hypothetical protein